jgi:DNA-binding phage protein
MQELSVRWIASKYLLLHTSKSNWSTHSLIDAVIVKLNQTEAVLGKEHFAKEFKLEAIRQVVERGFSVADFAKRLGVSTQRLYKSIRATQPTGEEKNKTEV